VKGLQQSIALSACSRNCFQYGRVMLVLKQGAEAAQSLIYLVVAGQMLSIRRTKLFGSFAFGKGMIGDCRFRPSGEQHGVPVVHASNRDHCRGSWLVT